MPRKPTLSPTKFSIFLACPTKYYWTYLDDRGKYFMRQKSYFSFGLSLHQVLQRFHDQGDKAVSTVDSAVAALEESWLEGGYASQQEMQEALGEGKTIVEAYIRQVEEAPSEAQTIMIEKMLRADFGDFVLMGRVDRVDEWPDGTLEVVDYKSGRADVTEDDIRNDLAMSCYQLLLHRQFQNQKVRATIIALRTGSRASYSLSAEELKETEAAVTELAHLILNRNWEEHVAEPCALCSSCDFLSLCQRNGLVLPSAS